MLKLGVDEQGILNRLAKSPTLFTLATSQEAELKEAGATTKVIAALKGNRPSSPMTRDLTDVAIVLDCSGSMKELTKERRGSPRIGVD